MTKTQNPPCAQWSVWIGKEIEGTSCIGQETLFVRALKGVTALNAGALKSTLTRNGRIERVWFCKEFSDWDTLRAIAKMFKHVCIEATPKTYETLPSEFRTESKYRIYLKVSMSLKPGDFICVGPAFSDESFEVGTGTKVNPSQYNNDTRIL